jgi:hypothetical protein
VSQVKFQEERYQSKLSININDTRESLTRPKRNRSDQKEFANKDLDEEKLSNLNKFFGTFSGSEFINPNK